MSESINSSLTDTSRLQDDRDPKRIKFTFGEFKNYTNNTS